MITENPWRILRVYPDFSTVLIGIAATKGEAESRAAQLRKHMRNVYIVEGPQ